MDGNMFPFKRQRRSGSRRDACRVLSMPLRVEADKILDFLSIPWNAPTLSPST